ncbi:unnamed protein product [Trifolium pratense]|uniref:Uncharacterized protein n=1 Tax=Trifolium pratense TaxID=57577 RepID=A0ACB0L143_TRIPR|nr:unnamed protein product [Trifolium pratense]
MTTQRNYRVKSKHEDGTSQHSLFCLKRSLRHPPCLDSANNSTARATRQDFCITITTNHSLCCYIEKSTQVEFTSCTTIIDFHLIHNFKVTTYVINSCAFLPLSAIFNLAVSDIVTITLSIATIQCPDRYSFTMLLTVLQLFDEMPKCLVAVWNAISCRLNFQDFIVEECDGHCLENCTTRLCHTTQIAVNLSNPTLKHHEDSFSAIHKTSKPTHWC